MGLSASMLAYIHGNDSKMSEFIHSASMHPMRELRDVRDVRTKEQWVRLKREMKHNPFPYVIMIYADWCSACKREKPVFMQAAAELHGKANFVCVCLSTTDTKNNIVNNDYMFENTKVLEEKIKAYPTIMVVYNTNDHAIVDRSNISGDLQTKLSKLDVLL